MGPEQKKENIWNYGYVELNALSEGKPSASFYRL